VAKHHVIQATTFAALSLTSVKLQDAALLNTTIGLYRLANLNFRQLCLGLRLPLICLYDSSA